MLHYFKPFLSLGKTSLSALKLDKIKVFKLVFLSLAAALLYFTVKEATLRPEPYQILINLGVFLWLVDFALNARDEHTKKISWKQLFKRRNDYAQMSPFDSLAHILGYVGTVSFIAGFILLLYSI